MLLVINASPFDIPQAKTREELLARRASENNVAIAYVNVVGGQDDLLFDGGALLVEPDGRIAARAPQFVDALLFADYDSDARRFTARDWPVTEDASDAAIVYAVSCAASATTWRRTVFRVCCSAFRAESIRVSRSRSRSTRSEPIA